MPGKTKMRTYERRITLFIDFLGFKELVDRTATDATFLDRIVDAMERVGKIGQVGKIGDGYEWIHKSQRATQFSDCVVVSYKVDEQSGVFDLLNNVAICVIQLASQGFLLRGGVTVGDLHHTGKHVVGPAMIEAYRLESKVAKYPRIVIDPMLIRAARKAHAPDDEEEYVRIFMTPDDDGHYFFDYVSWKSVVEHTGCDDEAYPGYLQTIGFLVRDGFQHADIGVVEKFLWLHKKYVTAIEFFESLPAKGRYRRESWEQCNAIESLRKFEDLVEKAKTTLGA
jgi:hypothetical protein